MPSGDVKTTIDRSRRGGWGGSREYHYDDQGRSASKGIWEWFCEEWEKDDFSKDWLMTRADDEYYNLIKTSVERYRLMDIAYTWSPGWSDYSDTRAHRLVIEKHDENTWLEFHDLMVKAYRREGERREKVRQEAASEREKKYAAYQAQREAEAAKLDRDEWEQMQKVIQPTAGMLMADLENSAFVRHEKEGYEGDWIEDIGSTYINGGGFGYEIEKATGTKLQVTVSLDLSNSMRMNGIADIAAAAFRDICLSLKIISQNYPEDIFYSFYTFSEDEYWGKRGRRAVRLEGSGLFGEMEGFRPHKLEDSYTLKALFNGEDTWIAPLFKKIYDWEQKESDQNAVRLDIIITDAVLEHSTDIRAADKIQEMRDGILQTVLLNFMPSDEWLDSTLPLRCTMVAVNEENIAGILRNILYEFVGVHL